MTNMKQEKPTYFGHRQRLRNRYIENGVDSLLEHEILELLLFYAIPRVDTKPLAHRLIDHYGSLQGVFNASYESLTEFGLSKSCAVLITLHASSEDWIRRKNVHGKTLCGYDEIGRLMVDELDGCKTEKTIMLLLDAKDRAIGIRTVSEGSFKGTHINMKNINEEIVLRKAAKVVFAHNHPSGNLRVSTEDVVATDYLENYLSVTGVELVEHYVVADGTYSGIKWQKAQREKELELLHSGGLLFGKDFQ